MTHLDALAIRRVLNEDEREAWGPPVELGPDGWMFMNASRTRTVIVTCADDDGGREWVHASMTGDGQLPSYDELAVLHRAVFGGGWAYQVFAPPAENVDIHRHALHLFGRLDGTPELPDFTHGTGSI